MVCRVYRILDGSAEAENVIYRDEDPESGFVVTPDLFVPSPSPFPPPSLIPRTIVNGIKRPSNQSISSS